VLYSDNTTSLHPRVLEWLVRADEPRFSVSYGDDDLSALVRTFMRAEFKCAQVQVAATGTGANVLALAISGAAHRRVATTSIAHLRLDEAGAPERSLGCQIVALESDDGLITPDQVASLGRSDAYGPPLAVVVISPATEHGRVYDLDAIAALADAAHALGARLHLDGARLSNAAASKLRLGYGRLFEAGVDTMTFSGTKNGAMSAEAVLVRPGLVSDLELSQTARSLGQLQSKSRYVAAQLVALLEDGLWLSNAGHANEMARSLADRLTALGHIPVFPVEANEVFTTLSPGAVQHLDERHLAAAWPALGQDGVRMVTSWATRPDDLDAVLSAFPV
jgi:threonine aldolase